MMTRRWWVNRTFGAGVACGVLLVFLLRLLVNETALPDYLVTPLLEPDSAASADAIVVPGAGVTGDCTPNLNSVRRVMLAARLWKDGRAPLLVFSGGQAGGRCPVAVAMSQLAQEVGVPQASIRTETRSATTHENAENSTALLNEAHARTLLIVTDRLHMRRALGVFARRGFDVRGVSVPIYEGHIDNVSMLAAGAREAAALAYYTARGWLGETAASRASRRTVEARPPYVGTTGAGGGTDTPAGGQMQKEAVKTGPIVVLGASYAGGWKVPEIAGVPVVNVGVSGEQSFEMLARFDRDVLPARPRAVILWGFINDIFRADDMEASLARVRESYVEMIARARSHGIEPIVATEVTMRDSDSWSDTAKSWIGWVMGKESYAARINRHVMAVNGWLRDLAAREGLLLLDIHGAVSDRTGARRREFISVDGSHINAAGYTAVTQYAVPVLSAHLSRNH